MSESDNVPRVSSAGSDPDTGRLLYRIPEAAAALAVSRTVIYELIQRGELQVVHIGISARVTAASLRAFVERRAAAERRTIAHGQM